MTIHPIAARPRAAIAPVAAGGAGTRLGRQPSNPWSDPRRRPQAPRGTTGSAAVSPDDPESTPAALPGTGRVDVYT